MQLLLVVYALLHGAFALRVDRISPHYGSLEGGTKVLVRGEGFSTDSYSTANLVFIGNHPCIVDWYHTSSRRILCTTTRYPWGAQEDPGRWSPWLYTTVISNGAHYTGRWGTHFQYNYWRTPQVQSVIPDATPIGSLVQVVGIYFYGDEYYDNYQGIYIGNHLCELRDPVTNDHYGIVYKSGRHHVTCLVTEQLAGSYNASVFINYDDRINVKMDNGHLQRGKSFNFSTSLILGHDNKLSMIELFPDIHSVSPHAGPSNGGTLLTIKGRGFGNDPALVAVDIDGTPCTVVSVAMDTLTCRTLKPPADSRAVVNVSSAGLNVMLEGVQDGYRFMGGRGVTLQQYLNIGGSMLTDLYSASSFPDSPDRYSVNPSFQSEEAVSMDSFGERYMTFFTPPFTGQYSLFISSDDQGELLMSDQPNITNVTRTNMLSSAISWNNWFQRLTAGEQRSQMMSLSSDITYLLIGHVKEGGSGNHLRVGYLLHDTGYRNNETFLSNREVQYITMETSGLYNIQELMVHVNWSAINENSPPTINIEWAGRTSRPLAVNNITAISMNETLEELISGLCHYDDDVYHYDDKVFGFENASADGLGGWGASRPSITTLDPFCGRRSLHVTAGRALLQFDSSEKLLTDEYPFFCFAYKIPQGVPVGLRLSLNRYGSCYYIPVTSYGDPSCPNVLHSFSSQSVIMDDDQWHYTCTDLHQLLLDNINTNDTLFEITTIGLYSDPAADGSGYQVDEISLSSDIRGLSQYTGPAQPNGISIDFIDVDVVNVTYNNDDTFVNYTVTMETVPATCDHVIPNMNVQTDADPNGAIQMIDTMVTQNASEALNGVFTISFMGHVTPTLPHDITPEEVRETLLQTIPDIGRISVWVNRHGLDKYHKYCLGRTIVVRFNSLPGDQPLLVVDQTQLSGDNLQVTVYEKEPGGLFVRPIPGHQLRTVETTPQVHVTVNSVTASCSGDHPLYHVSSSKLDPCYFIYGHDLNPMATSIMPTAGRYGDSVTITGSSFSVVAMENIVKFGDVSCNVTSSNDTVITCTLEEGEVGQKPLDIEVLNYGIASIPDDLYINYTMSLAHVMPSSGSVAGGTIIAITGYGFLEGTTTCPMSNATTLCSDWIVSVDIDGQDCSVISISSTDITCSTPNGTVGAANVTVTATCCQDNSLQFTETIVGGFTYNSSVTATVMSITPITGSAAGGDLVTVTGLGFVTIETDSSLVAVMIGDAICNISSINDTNIVCVTSPHPPGVEDVLFVITEHGQSHSNVQFTYNMNVTSWSPCEGSWFGGQEITINGSDLIGSNGQYDDATVSLGNTECEISMVTANGITCTTKPNIITHIVDNNVYNEEYGLGYMWNPQYITVTVGDTVRWSWTGSTFGPKRNVAQVSSATSDRYNGYGFRSSQAVTGSYSYTFTQPGVYYYIAEGYADIGFHGSVNVTMIESELVPVTITINGIQPVITASCSFTSCPNEMTSTPSSLHYKYSSCLTPVIQEVNPTQLVQGQLLNITVNNMRSPDPGHMITIGRSACMSSSLVVAGGIGGVSTISCATPTLLPGVYTVKLQVTGQGMATAAVNNSIVEYYAQVSMIMSVSEGSLKGGTEITIPALDFYSHSISNTRVVIGNTPCDVQYATMATGGQQGNITCITRSAQDDGYSSLVLHSSPLGYWNMQLDHYYTDGQYLYSNPTAFPNLGSTGSHSNALPSLGILAGQHGISGNNVTDQSILFNASYLHVPYHPQLNQLYGFGMEFWIKGAERNSWGYQIVLSSLDIDVASGYLVMLNPCGYWEVWLGSGDNDTSMVGSGGSAAATGDCPLITMETHCSNYSSCNGSRVIPDDYSSYIAGGVWDVTATNAYFNVSNNNWTHVLINYITDNGVADDERTGLPSDDLADFPTNRTDCYFINNRVACHGTLELFIDTLLAASSPVQYSPALSGDLLIGGIASNGSLAHFVGYLDEVSVYGMPVSNDVITDHHYYGNSADQPVWLIVEGVADNVRELTHLQVITWDNITNNDIIIDNNTAIQIEWTGSHGVRQVTKSAYHSCDLEGGVVKQWASNRIDGRVTIDLPSGQTYYFIDSVVGNCDNGHKITVKVGTEHLINWRLGVTYSNININVGEGLVFRWDGSIKHNLIEMKSRDAVTDCTFVGDDSVLLGKVVREWLAEPAYSGEVYITKLTPGDHYFVCSVGGHCNAGMRITVHVEGAGANGGSGMDPGPITHAIPWRIQDYESLTISELDSLHFAWNGYHSLHQVTSEQFDSCDISSVPLHEWAEPSVDNSVTIKELAPGTYYYYCAVSGHCDAGMKLQVTVIPVTSLSSLQQPVKALCQSSRCSFTYHSDVTPQLISIVDDQVMSGDQLILRGRGLVDSSVTAGSHLSDVSIWFGGVATCSVVTYHNTSNDIQQLGCVVGVAESGYYHVDAHVKGRGFATTNSLQFGPIRNSSYPASNQSPYPYVFVAATVTSVIPNMGSVAGGTEISIHGNGFSNIMTRNSVMIGGIPCTITSSHYSLIMCVTGVSSQDRTATLSLTVNSYTVTNSVSYTYSTMATPMITGISVANGNSVQGGDWLVITGDQFTNDTNLVTVTIMSDPVTSCNVTSASNDTINCTLPHLPAGQYQLTLHIVGMGNALPSSPALSTVTYTATIVTFTPDMVGFGGGVVISLYGNGFPLSDDSDVEISMCGVSCDIITTNLTDMTCQLGQLPTVYSSMMTVSCNVTITYPTGPSFVADDPFIFNNSLTPQLTSITPSTGGTAGGTIVNITGNDFLPPGVSNTSLLIADDIIVTIDTAQCIWYGISIPSNTLIMCRSSDHHTVIGAAVNVVIRGRGAVMSQNVSFDYVDYWSSPYTWGGIAPPSDGESVYIKTGHTVVLDIDTAMLNLLIIEGSLIFEDKQDLHLQAKYIFINNGRLQVGTEDQPFLHRATITLHGTIDDPEIPIYGAKVLAVRQGELDLHGRPRNVTWVRLAQTANKNSSLLHVLEPVDWLPGDQIVIASTTKDGNETETNFVTMVTNNGVTIMLSHPLNYTHHGVTESFTGGHSIDIRAEVGLLSHNVVVQGSRLNMATGLDGLGADEYGSQIMIHRSGPHPTPIRIEHTEVRYGGQAFRLGRYAIHFHLTGSMRGSYIRHCSIHHSNNRAITAHGVHDLLIEGNVGYDVKGHMFFVEDGIETGNRYINNLGVVCRGSSSLLNTDQIPAVFWITNPNNTFTGNAAVASRAYGFWYDLDDNPSGASFTRLVCPNKLPLGTFTDNVAHTCNEFGFRIWETYTPFVDGCAATTPSTATFYNLVSYSNGIHGLELSVVGHVQLVGFKVADNRDNGMEVQETHGVWGGALIENSLIISHTSINTGSAATGGIKTPNTPRLTIRNVTFVNFDANGTACLRACSQCKELQGGFQVWLEQLHFINSDQFKTAFQWEHEVLYWDIDGSLTGYVGGWVTPSSELHPPQYCNQSVIAFSRGSFPGSVCTSEVYFLRLSWNQVEPLSTFIDVGVNVTNEFGLSVVPWRHYRLTHVDGYMVTMPSGYPHKLVWDVDHEHRVDVTSYSAGVYAMRERDHVMLTHEFVKTPDHVEIGRVYNTTGRPLVPTDSLHSWHIDNTTNTTTVTYLLTGANSTHNYSDILYRYSYEACPRSGCPSPPRPGGPIDANYRRWSDVNSWVNTTLGRAPIEGEDVVINSSWRMLLDVNPPSLGRVFVYGELKFEDERDYNFTADLVLVDGPNSKLVIGEESTPFDHSVIITLTGVRGTPDYALSRRMNLGSKAMGIFGNVSLIGERRSVTWTRLANNASQGGTEITLAQSGLDWRVGEEIVIAPSEYEPDEAEVRTIVAISGDRITLHRALSHDHVIHSFLEQSDCSGSHDPSVEGGNLNSKFWWGDGGRLAPEVGLLSRNIVIQGGEHASEPLEMHHYGCRILVGSYTDSHGDTQVGRALIDSVELRYCGQGGYFSARDPRYSLAFKDLKNDGASSYVRRSSIHHGYNTAIGVHSSNHIELSSNVIYRTTDSSVKLGGSSNTLTHTLAILTSTIQPNSPKDNHAVDYPSTFEVDRGQVVRHNAAGGSYRIGYKFAGERCVNGNHPAIGNQADFWNNTAHSGLLGLLITGLPLDCTSVAGFTGLRHYDYSVFSSIASPLVVSHMILAIGKAGFNLNIFGPDPIRHLLGRKWIKIEKSLIVGNIPGELCDTRRPSIVVPSSSFSLQSHKLGVMMSSFNQRRSKMDGTGKWHLMKGYPVIDGVLDASNVTFARFFNLTDCSNYGVYTIGNNPLSPDAVHPMQLTDSTKLNTDKDSIAFYYPPDPAWIVQEDCIDMDCDGPKHALVRDVDGSLLGSSPLESSIVPYAELRFDESRTPETWLANAGPLNRYLPSDVIMGRGISKGHVGNLSAINGGCVWVPSWQAYCCRGLQHHMMVIESMDADTETRRLSPLALVGGDVASINYTDLMNGPMDHGWCTYYTCLKRLSTFFSLVAVGNTDYQMWMTGSLPGHLRIHLLNAAPDDVIRLHIWYKNPQRKDVYRNGIFIEPKDVEYLPDGRAVKRPGNVFMPSFADSSGSNYFERDSMFLHIVIKGSDPIEIRTPPVVQVSLDLSVSLDDFFESEDFVQYLASVLQIDISMIRVVDIVSEDTPLQRRRRNLENSVNMTLILEIGDPPQNGSAIDIPPVTDDYNQYNNESVDVDGEGDAELTNGTGLPVEDMSSAVSNNPLNEDPPASEEDFMMDYAEEVEQFMSDGEQYMMEVERVVEVNTIVEAIVAAFQTGNITVENATVTGLSLIPATVPVPPPVPAVPINYSNSSVQQPEPLPSVNLSVVIDNETGSVTYSVPTNIKMFIQPSVVSSHLVYVVVEITDVNNDRVLSLGVINSWNCTAYLSSHNRSLVSGLYTVSFVNGTANFTRMRVDEPINDVQLTFTTYPGGLTVQSNIFTVITPPPGSRGQLVQFKLSGGSFNDVVVNYELFLVAVQQHLGQQLDIDISRVTKLKAYDGSIVIEAELLDRYASDPPDVSVLDDTLMLLQFLVNSGQFYVVYNQHTLYAESGSYSEVGSQSATSSEDDDVNWVVLGPVVGVAAIVVLATLVTIVIIHCYCTHSNRNKKAAKLSSRDCIVTNQFAMQPRSSSSTASSDHYSIDYSTLRTEESIVNTTVDHPYLTAADNYDNTAFTTFTTNMPNIPSGVDEVDRAVTRISHTEVGDDYVQQNVPSQTAAEWSTDYSVNKSITLPPRDYHITLAEMSQATSTNYQLTGNFRDGQQHQMKPSPPSFVTPYHAASRK